MIVSADIFEVILEFERSLKLTGDCKHCEIQVIPTKSILSFDISLKGYRRVHEPKQFGPWKRLVVSNCEPWILFAFTKNTIVFMLEVNSCLRICTIAPGMFATAMTKKFPEPLYQSLASQVQYPKRFGTPAEFAQCCQFITENQYMNGEVIRLDGTSNLLQELCF